MQIQISWLLQKPTDLDLHCLQSQGISGFSRTRVKEDFVFMQLNPFCTNIKKNTHIELFINHSPQFMIFPRNDFETEQVKFLV